MRKFPKMMVTADVVLFRNEASGLEVLLIERGHEPCKGAWALPGGFFDLEDKDLAAAAARELEEETGVALEREALRLVGVFSKRGRDPREFTSPEPCRSVTAAYWAYAPPGAQAKAGDDARTLRWFPIDALPVLAFDHAEILSSAIAQAPT